MAIPAVLTLGWAYARRGDPVFPTRVAYVMGGATALQVVIFLAPRSARRDLRVADGRA